MKVLFIGSGNNNKISPFISEQADSLKKLSIEIDYYRINGKGIRGYLKNGPKLSKAIQNFNPDILHAHYGLSGFLSVLQRKKPVVITFHGSDIYSKKTRLLSFLANRLSSASIFVSVDLKKKIMGKNSYVIPCGIDMDVFKPMNKSSAKKKIGLKEDMKYILFPSSFSNPVKNYSLAKKSLHLLNQKNVHLNELNGYSREEVNLLINSSECLLMTSFSEGSSQIMKETLACNKPVISTDVGDARKLIGNSPGNFITSFNAEEIMNVLKEVLNNPPAVKNRSIIIQNELDLESVAKKIIKVYESVLN